MHMPSRVISHEIVYKEMIRNCKNISLVRVISLQELVFLVLYDRNSPQTSEQIENWGYPDKQL
jgi:hypothetical protein